MFNREADLFNADRSSTKELFIGIFHSHYDVTAGLNKTPDGLFLYFLLSSKFVSNSRL